ncbi:histidine phosphatase family protein [Streptomyces coeruleorubidus]|uniref:histidine phosphatase family protein n=1 Tax=Streptomyces coeruleorubidus TaxID=116188 RepID=UPI00237F5164|nr:histidine phosphatase family protein [Streptomyces coeruleorubidus]WDV51321.1 histidine phosphatase family protein [Streptomyces coeruleorubidus]
MREFIVEADGGSRGNPGPAGYGAVVSDAATGETLREAAEYLGVATNNVAEYRGLLAGLRAAHELDPAATVHVRMDSKLVIEQMSGRWKIKHPDMKPLAADAARIFPPGRVTYEWIPRERNKHADRLANEAMDAGARGEQWSASTSTAELDTSAGSVAPQGPPGDAAAGAARAREALATGRAASATPTGSDPEAGPPSPVPPSVPGAAEQRGGEGASAGTGAGSAKTDSDVRGARTGADARAANADADVRAARAGADARAARADADARAAKDVATGGGAPAEAGADVGSVTAEEGVRGARAGADVRGARADSDVRGAKADADARAPKAGADACADKADAAARAGKTDADLRADKADADARAAKAVATQGWAPADMGAPATFVLLRHGETPLTPQKRFSGSGGTDPSLSDAGREQAERAAALLARRGTIQAIVSSPLARTRETAGIIAARLGLDVSVDDGLRETDFGAWEGLTFAEVRERHPDDLNAWLASPDAEPTGGGESFTATATRIAATRDKLIAAYTGRTVLLVTHVTPIKTFVRLALGAPPESLFRMELSAASLSVVAYYADGNASVRLLNDTSHLR